MCACTRTDEEAVAIAKDLEKANPGIQVIVKTAANASEQANQLQDLVTVNKITSLVVKAGALLYQIERDPYAAEQAKAEAWSLPIEKLNPAQPALFQAKASGADPLAGGGDGTGACLRARGAVLGLSRAAGRNTGR